MKFSLLTLLGAVAIAAVGCAALTNPLPGSVMAVSMATILLLFGAVLVAIDCRGTTRAFCRGFAICGWGYLLFLWVGPRSELYPAAEGRLLPTTWALDELAEASIDQDPTPLATGYTGYVVTRSPRGDGVRRVSGQTSAGTGTPNRVAWSCLLQIGHTLWALILAFAGGVLARGLYGRQQRQAHQ